MPGVLVGGLMLGIVESFAGQFFGPEHALTIWFTLLILLLMVRPTGIMGRRATNDARALRIAAAVVLVLCRPSPTTTSCAWRS